MPGSPGSGPKRPELDLAHPLVGSLLGRCTFPPSGSPVTCAVSGGADSLTLLVLAVAAGCEVTAVHVDHGLRPGSAAEADLVADVAARLGAAFRSERVRVDPGSNLEARAREARLAVLPDDVLTGHTADDRAETVLLNLIRGAGPRGLTGMARSPRRPIIDLRRRETVELCERLGLDPVQDPSNLDPVHRRNRVRHELLPLLADIGDRDVVPILVRQADLFAEVEEEISEWASGVDATSVAELRTVARPQARAAIRAWLLDAGANDGYPVDGAALDRILDVVHGGPTATEVAGGWRVSRSRGRLRVTPPR